MKSFHISHLAIKMRMADVSYFKTFWLFKHDRLTLNIWVTSLMCCTCIVDKCMNGTLCYILCYIFCFAVNAGPNNNWNLKYGSWNSWTK